jgi:hypothetical protein
MQHTAVTLTFTFDQAEHYRAFREVAAQRTAMKWGRRLLFAFFLVMFVANIAEWGLDPDMMWQTWLPHALVLVSLAAIPLVERRAVSRALRVDSSAVGPQERRLDAVGFHGQGNGANVDLPWRMFARGFETKKFLLFVLANGGHHYIPKRVLTPDQLVESRALIRTGLGERAVLF